MALNQVDRVWLAMSKLRRRKFDECIEICTDLLNENNLDQAVWLIKCKALTAQQYLDDTEMEEEGVAEILLDENATASMPRPGTSLNRPKTQAGGGGANQSMRPMTSSGRPLTGFARPGTGSRPTTGGQVSVETAMKGNRPGTSRPLTSLGREVRLGTASMATDIGGPFLNVERLDLAKYAKRPSLAMVLCDYLVYHDRNPRKGLELAAEATVHADYKDWWWKARLGKCYYKLGLFRDAERQLKSSLKDQDMVVTTLELVKVYMKLDLPNTALDLLMEATEKNPGESRILLGIARIHDMLSDHEEAVQYYKRVLHLDSSNVESIASLAANHFYSDQPEIALRYYRRLLQMGVNNTELWNNLGLSCFYASQYDMALGCFERSLTLASDENMADVWYNVGQVAIGIGDLGLAYQAFKIGVSIDSNHAECYCNLGVLELRKQNIEAARANFKTAQNLAPFAYEPFYNGALIAYKLGEFQEAFATCSKALEIYPEHTDSKELLQILKNHFAVL